MAGSETFAARLRRLREAAGLTQEELADRAGLSSKAVSLLERGERTKPYPHTVSSLADALGLPEDERAALVAAARGRTASATRAASYAGMPPTPLLGREQLLHEIAVLLQAGETRLLTLTGPGGVGKTRLAQALLAQQAGAWPAGEVFVPLAPVSSPDLALPTIAHALGLGDDGRDPGVMLAHHLTGRRMLLVLDNLEHLVPAVDHLAPLLELPGGPVVVATSRRPLRLRGEVEHAVPPLWTPQSAHPSAAAVLGSPAGRLFAQRAQAVSQGFEVTEDNAAEVAAICRQLAGIPLALEIAAARTRFLGTTQLLARIDRLMTEEGARDLDDRQRTLARTLDWSHDLLGADEQVVFARLSVFAGSFGLEAAEVVGGAGDDIDVLACLEQLVEHSLVTVDLPTGAGEARYRLLEPVRQYAAARLRAAGEEEATRLAHAQWYVALAEAAYPHIERGEQVEWLDLLRAENDNLRAAIAWSIGSGHPDLAVRFGWSLRMYWLHHDRREEGRLLLEQVPDRDAAPPVERARLLHVLSFCHYGFGGPHLALSREALDLFREAGDVVGEEYALGQLGFALLSEGDADGAREALEAALELSLARGDETQAGHLLNHLAAAALQVDDRPRAAELAERALGHARHTGERLAQQTALQILAQLAWADGDLPRARELFSDSLQHAVELSDDVNAAYCLRGLAVCDGEGGCSPEATQLFGEAATVLEAAGSPRFAWLMPEFEEAVSSASAGEPDDC
ncbi:ATP-binding protein [Nocardioides taihuensis]|uniref:ATP-binding protein n=1 Tax=Nocardioides taihuensis TaxID=1835606 RepID=A0ABW0BGX6_9ACTN